MGIFIGIVLIILVGIVVGVMAYSRLPFYRLTRRTGKSINRYIESE